MVRVIGIDHGVLGRKKLKTRCRIPPPSHVLGLRPPG
jgi:hypothetical protein